MRIFKADTEEDIDNWPCALSVFSGQSCHGNFCKQCLSKDVLK